MTAWVAASLRAHHSYAGRGEHPVLATPLPWTIPFIPLSLLTVTLGLAVAADDPRQSHCDIFNLT